MPERLYNPDWFEHIDKGIPVSFTYTELPVEELLILNELSEQYPGLRFNLRKQRGRRYLLTLLPTRHINEEKAKGEP